MLSITPSYAQLKLSEGKTIGKQLQKFKSNIDEPLAAILTLNTFAHTIGAIGVGEQATLIWHDANPMLTGVLVPLIMTLSILILSELIPKTIGANYWKELTYFTIYSLRVLIVLLYPVIWLCQFLTRAFRRDKSKSIFSRSDFIAMAEIGEKQGVFSSEESDFIENSLDLFDITVIQIMRPKSEMVHVTIDVSVQDVLDTIKDKNYSRYPVLDPKTQKIVGVIHAKDILTSLDSLLEANSIKSVIRPILKISYSLPTMDLLRKLRSGMPHFALVYDENKELSGFITFDNLLHAMFGLINDEFNRTQNDWIKNTDGSVTTNGNCSLFSLERALDIDIALQSNESDVTTVGELLERRSEKDIANGDLIETNEFDAYVESLEDSNIQKVRFVVKIK